MAGDSDSGEKTEQPTQKKIKDSREKGQVAQSKELTAFASMVTVVMVLWFNYRNTLQSFASNSNDLISLLHSTIINDFDIHRFLTNTLIIGLKITLMPVILAACISLLMNVIQLKGIVLSKEFLKFDFTKLNPVSNFQSVFSLKNLVKFFRQMVEITIMTFVAYFLFKDNITELIKLYYLTLPNIILAIVLIFAKIFAFLFLIHFIFGIVDLLLEKRSLNKQLMMSLHELKEEYKNTDGNPEVKQRRRELHQELLEEDEWEALLSNATLVVANPEHIAVVLLYKPALFKLPIVLAKAKNSKAQMVFRIAKKLGMPVVRDKWLARQLFTLGELGKYVPSSLLKYVADLIGKNLLLLPILAKELIAMNKAKTQAIATH